MATISGYRGDTLNYVFDLCHSGSAFTVGSHNVTFTIKERNSDSACVFQSDINSTGIYVDGGCSNRIHVPISYSCSATFKTGPHVYDIQADTTASGRYTLGAGTFCVIPDITF